MNKTISLSQLKNLVMESEEAGWCDCADAVCNAVEKGEMTWEEVAREALFYMTEDNIADMARKNGWDLGLFEYDDGNDSIDITDGIPSEDEYLAEKSSFGDPDENDYVYEPDPSGELDLNGNPKMIKRAKGFGDDWKRVKGKVKGWFSRK